MIPLKPSFGAAFDFGALVCLLSGGELYQSDSGVECNSLSDSEYVKCVPCLAVTGLSVKVAVLRIASINLMCAPFVGRFNFRY